jgi:mannose-6-phosphate isomerase-like protein (cupin superfamily)
MKLIIVALLGAVFAFPAGDPQGFFFWKSADLKAFSKSLSPKMDAKKFATQRLGENGNHFYLMVHREGTADAELHETQADVIIVQTGEGTLVYGGQMVDGKTTAPNEIRGPGISGGSEKPLLPGDVVEMPAKVPHWVKVAPGKQLTYLVVKVTQ